ncbi:hypothetical protein GCM10010977_18130 [Citricoccus zhacaiensis]|uniref:Uncharacterized protein n=1 Tax=Citricoccus zhacaiensis TaxID=489142 RepID=A0ABQ2LZU1_9MICC|nr:hypothetical protein [Citricoccus zhacaiensis]GGO45419.1 hypothetical protein GCM10010977_18130 [Citricoccus zhacaiensis]
MPTEGYVVCYICDDLSMYIVPLKYPGTRLELEPRELGRDVDSLLRNLSSGIAEAAIALGWFETERQRPTDLQAEWEQSMEFRRKANQTVRELNGGDLAARDWDAERAEADEIALRLSAESGVLPSAYRHQITFIHARTYLYSLDSIAKSLGTLSTMPGMPAGVTTALADWEAAFPSVKAIRDSAHHMEDRARSLGRKGKPLELKPIDNGAVYAPGGGVLILNSLNGSRFGTTTASGDFEEVDVTPMSLESARHVVQATIDAFTWRGPSRLEPTA